MSRTKRARSPAAEYEVDLHSPTRRRIKHNKPRVHARPLACAYDSSDDDDSHPSSDDDSSLIDGQGLVIVFEETPSATSPGSPQGAHERESSLLPPHDSSHTTSLAIETVAPHEPSAALPWTPALTPSTPAPQPDPRPEPIADRLRRMAKALRAENEAARHSASHPPANHDLADAPPGSMSVIKDDDYIRNNVYLRGLVEEGKLGVYLDSSNHTIVRIVDCAPDPVAARANDRASPPQTFTRRVRVQPPPELRHPHV
ncbi:hypothetical protein EXIGLDRAFT_781481 [Exidia glandulosa HHB12029]|uniref:Uncharacterized protein n=1 Tax=Exidia glandulosa HHB12029 TaxID=1314781 RepID=A0A165B8E4_EXIGL|nr:hypothetical protein EXIGLDRAFT_781481 [Exidia glandulosa HHB12029]